MVVAEHHSPPRGRTVPTVRIRVQGGYEPPVVYGRVGEPLRLVFSRGETSPCSEHVVFPAFGMSAMLPPFEDVAIEFVPEHAGEYEFTCQMGVLRGRLVVAGDAGAPSPAGSRRITNVETNRRGTARLAFVAWLCSLPLLLLVAVPLLGWRAGGLLALLWFGVVAGACFAVCVRRIRRPASLRRRTA